ncbi:MAG: helix-turn-helix transcriptional regulator [Clostridia bacterium]
MFEVNLSTQLRRLREHRNLTQAQVAEYLNISRPTYTYYEIGRTEPRLQTLVMLSKLYGVSVDEILNPPQKRRKK